MPMFRDRVWVNRNMPLLGFNDIARIHDEWYNSIDMHLFILMGCCVGKMKTPSVNFEEL